MEPANEQPKNDVPMKETAIAKQPSGHWKSIGLIFLCFVAGAIGSTVVLFAQGDMQQAATSNTRQVVSSEGDLIARIAEDLAPSTVSVTTQSVTRSDFFGPAVQEGAGTGIVVSRDGYVLTNRHVIPEGVGSVNVIMSDGKEYKDVRVVGRDSLNDLAFLKISGVSDLKPAEIGDSSGVRVGQKVVALGNALGQFQNTVTTGVISGLSRPITAGDGQETERLENLFQTDAAINPGNSGGPLVNLDGKVIGVNTAVAEGAEGIGFAIPIDDVKGLIASVTEKGRLIRPYIGVRSVTLTPDIAAEIGIDTKQGAFVLEQNGVVNGSPADDAGVKPGDVITKVNNQDVGQKTLGSIISQYRVGEELTLEITRGNDQQSVRVTPEELPNNR